MSVQDYVVRTLIRDDFDERFQAAVDETEKFYGAEGAGPDGVAAEEVTADEVT